MSQPGRTRRSSDDDPFAGLGLPRAGGDGPRLVSTEDDTDDPFAGLSLPKSRAGNATATGIRVLPAVAGGFFGPIGGAVGAAVGELGAQVYEGEGFNLPQVGLQAGLGAIPGAKVFRDLKGFSGLLARGGVNAGVGAAIGGPAQVLTDEVAREGLEGLNVFDLEPGVMDRLETGAKWGAGFGAAGSAVVDGASALLRGRAAGRQSTIDSQFDPNFDSRYKAPVRPPRPEWNGDAALGRVAASSLTPAAPDLSQGLPGAIPLPTPGELPPPIPMPFAPPPVTPVAPVESMPLMARPQRSYDDLFDGLDDSAAPPPVAEPEFPPDLQQLIDLGVDPAVVRQLTPEDAIEVMRGLQDDIAPPTVTAREGLAGVDADLFDAYMARALETSPDVTPSVVRENFDYALERFFDRQREASEGLGPRELFKAIAERGGLAEPDDFAGDQWNRERRPNAELARIKDLAKNAGYTDSGRFGTALGIKGVFPKNGLPIDQMVADLRDDPRFANVEYPNDLANLLEEALIADRAAPARRSTPRIEDLLLPESMTALGSRPQVDAPEANPLDEILRIFAEEYPESRPVEVLQREGFAIDAAPPPRPVDAPQEFGPAPLIDRRASAESFTPDVQRDLMMELAGDPAAVSGGRQMMRRLSDINANRIEEPVSGAEVPRGADPLEEALAPVTSVAQGDVPRLAGLQDSGNGILQVQFDAGRPVTVDEVKSMFPGRNIEVVKFAPNIIRPDIQRFRIDVFDENYRMSSRVAKEMADEAGSGFRDWGEQPRGQFLDPGTIKPDARDITDVFDTFSARPADAPPAPTKADPLRDMLLPGTEDVRAIENATPEVADVPFSLEAPAAGVKLERAARGAREASAQSSLDDIFGNPERGAIAPGALGSVGGAAVGGVGGAATIDEDDSTGEKVAKVLGGIAVGAGVGGTRSAGGSAASSASAPTRRAPDGTNTITPPRGAPVTLPKYAGNINLERLNTTDSVKQTINEIAENLRPQMENARRGRIAQDVTRQMAAELGMTEAELLSRRRGQAFNAEQALAAREINAASARRLTEAANAVREAPTPENYNRLMSSLQQQVAIQEQIAGATAEAGRSLAQFRMMANDTLSLPELNELVMTVGGTESLDALARRIQELDPTNIRAMNQFAREASKATMGDKVYEAWINALLSGPVTHVANTVSNGLTAMTHPVERTVAGLLDLLRAKASGTPQERFAREGAYAVVGLWKGAAGGVRAGLTAAMSDTPAFGLGRQETAPGGKIGGTAGHVIRTPSKALLFEDEFFKNIVYSADLHARAVRTAVREGLKGRAVGTRVAEILQNPSENMRQAGQKEALYRTFNTPLTARWEKALMQLRTSVPGARWIIPFVRTPINVAKFGLERTPLYLGKVMADIASGKLSLEDLPEESAKVAIGATLAMGVASAYQNGLITGGGSPDRSKHATQAVTRPDYSVKVGDQWYSFQRLEPAGIAIGLVADFMETLETGKQDVEQLPAKMLYSFAKNIQSKTFLQGLTGFFNVLSDYPRYGDEWINRMGGSLVPTAVAQVSRARDPIARKPGSVKEAITNRMGGGQSLPPMIDVFGKPITSDMDPLERLLSPVQRRKVVEDPIIDEMNRLGITLSVPSERLTVEGHELTRAQKSTLAQARGQGVKRELDEILASPAFQRGDDDARRDRIERAINQARDRVSARARARIRRDLPLTLEDLLGMDPAQ